MKVLNHFCHNVDLECIPCCVSNYQNTADMLDVICCTILNYVLFQLVVHPPALLKKEDVLEWVTELGKAGIDKK